jgi:lactate dehydrogenase-like 2-hydroxyacid dehydrogenase
MKIKLECPIDFLSKEEISSLLHELDYQIDNFDPQVIIVNPGTKNFLDYSHFSSYKNLKIVATPSTGTNHIDVKSLKEKDVIVVSLLDDREALNDIHASAEFTWLHIMNLIRKFSKAINCVDDWRSQSNESYLRSNELYSKSIGIIGLGRIGKKIAKYADAFGIFL